MPAAPHGGKLVNRLDTMLGTTEISDRLSGLPVLRLDPVGLSDLELLATGGYSP